MTQEHIDSLFSYHPPKDDQIERYNLIREKARELATVINENTPSSGEQTLAIRYLHLSVMEANAAIAVNE